jgi:hypothetical protein
LEITFEKSLRHHHVQKYAPQQARTFLSSLKTKQGKNTLKHIRALASAMFSEAIERNLRPDNPWHVKVPKDCKDTEPTQHYTMEQAENFISVFVDQVDAQLVIALSWFDSGSLMGRSRGLTGLQALQNSKLDAAIRTAPR